MIISGIVLAVVAVVLFTMYRTNRFIHIIGLSFLIISTTVIIGSIYVSKTMSTTMSNSFHYRIYYFLNGMKMPISTISRIFNFSIAMYLAMCAIFMGYIYKMGKIKTVLMLLPCVFFLASIDPENVRRIHAAVSETNISFIYYLMSKMNLHGGKVIIVLYLTLPVIMAMFQIFNTSVFIKKRDIAVSCLCVLCVNVFMYFGLIRGIYQNIMFDRVNVAMLPMVKEVAYTDRFVTIFLWVTVILVITMIMLFRPFWVTEKTNGLYGNNFKTQNKNLSMILHAYKNAFLGVSQQFTLIKANIEKEAYDKALHNAEIGQGIATEYMEALNKTLSLIGNSNIKYSKVDLLYCINKAMQKVSIPAEGNIKLDFQTDSEYIAVLGDERHLTEMFVNMILNSAEALMQKKNSDARIKIGVFEEGNLVQVTIHDNGTGIERKNYHKIFNPFFSTKTSTSGGVGLSYVSNVIKQHHGNIRVKSIVDEYTEFQIALPIYNERNRRYG